jgi:hypothetical protein
VLPLCGKAVPWLKAPPSDSRANVSGDLLVHGAGIAGIWDWH